MPFYRRLLFWLCYCRNCQCTLAGVRTHSTLITPQPAPLASDPDQQPKHLQSPVLQIFLGTSLSFSGKNSPCAFYHTDRPCSSPHDSGSSVIAAPFNFQGNLVLGKKQSQHPCLLPLACRISHQLPEGKLSWDPRGRHSGQELQGDEVFDVCFIYLCSSHRLPEHLFLPRSDKLLPAPACPPLPAPFSARLHLFSMHQRAPAPIPAGLPSLPCSKCCWCAMQTAEPQGSAGSTRERDGDGSRDALGSHKTDAASGLNSPLPFSQLS